jgi:hypothetical protein
MGSCVGVHVGADILLFEEGPWQSSNRPGEWTMKKSMLAAGALAAALVVGVTGAVAADLEYDRTPSSDRRRSAYEDPRYRDIYGPAPIPHRAGRGYYTAEPVPPLPPAYVYRERARDRDDEDDDRAYAPPDRRSFRRDHDTRTRTACAPHEEIKRRLIDEGWRDFQDIDLRGGLARIEARRRGDIYVLRIDQCSGDIVNAQRLGRSDGGSTAYEPDRPRRPYY